MKRYVFLSVMLLSMLAVPAAFSQEVEPEDMEMRMQMRQREMDLKQREADMDMERQMKQLDLEQRKMELERARQDRENDCRGVLGVLLLICAVVHILVAVWVYMDIRQLNRGSGLWIVIALLTGLLGALVYAVVRIGDGRQKGS
jgi:ABC-type transport system involved in cytochrome bd biosynthesis fused ATPase/permease subunit